MRRREKKGEEGRRRENKCGEVEIHIYVIDNYGFKPEKKFHSLNW